MHVALDGVRPATLKAPKFDGGRLIGPPLEWLESAELIDEDDVEILRDRAEDALRRIRKVRSELGEGLLHGDAHRQNAAVGPLGPVLLDFENVCRGPREWDLIPTALRFERFGGDEREWAAFSEGYGYDVREWPGYKALLELSALSETCFTLVNYSRFRQEAEKRLRYWRRPNTVSPAWNIV
jgi:Ser/Thr protein kinase RdoA (MazF antagonist)